MKRLRVNIHELTKEKGRMKREQKLLEEELAVVPALTTIHISTNVACCQSLRWVCKGFNCYDKQSDSSDKTLSALLDVVTFSRSKNIYIFRRLEQWSDFYGTEKQLRKE